MTPFPQFGYFSKWANFFGILMFVIAVSGLFLAWFSDRTEGFPLWLMAVWAFLFLASLIGLILFPDKKQCEVVLLPPLRVTGGVAYPSTNSAQVHNKLSSSPQGNCHPALDAGSSQIRSSYKSFQFGLLDSINFNFHSLFHFLSCFSLEIALVGSDVCS